MKVLFRSMFALMALLLVSAPVAAQEGSIVFLDSERLRQEAPGIQTARVQLQERMARLEARADSALRPMQAELQEMMTAFQQQRGMMTAQTRGRDSVAIAQKQLELQQAGQTWQGRADSIQASILAPVLNEINAMIQQLRAERGYAYILDAAAGGVLAADPELDITDEVLQMLRARANAGS